MNDETAQKRLIDVIPHDSYIHDLMMDKSSPEYRLGQTRVVKEMKLDWPGKHKNVFAWWILEDGRAVGWNENPALGWSFPVIKYKEKA